MYKMINSLKEGFQHMRDDVDTYHGKWFVIAENLEKKIDFFLTSKIIYGVNTQMKRNKMPRW